MIFTRIPFMSVMWIEVSPRHPHRQSLKVNHERTNDVVYYFTPVFHIQKQMRWWECIPFFSFFYRFSLFLLFGALVLRLWFLSQVSVLLLLRARVCTAVSLLLFLSLVFVNREKKSHYCYSWDLKFVALWWHVEHETNVRWNRHRLIFKNRIDTHWLPSHPWISIESEGKISENEEHECPTWRENLFIPYLDSCLGE